MATVTMSPVTKDPAAISVHPPGETGWLTPTAVAALTPDGVREKIRALKPLIAEYAEESERLGYPHPKVWEAIRATGFFYHFVPKAYGGCEFGPEDFFLTAQLICEACASTGWAATFTNEHNWVGGLFPKEAQDVLFANGRYFLAPLTSTPPGNARKVDGGYIVNTHWKWGSGVMHSNWAMGLVMLMDEEGGPPKPLMIALPMSQATVLDTWHVAGLKATGSNDVVVKDAFVPDYMAVPQELLSMGLSPGSQINDNPMYKMPFSGFLSLVVSVPVIGAARGAVEIFRERIKVRKVTGTQAIVGDKANYQSMLAKADMMVRTSELLLQTLTRSVLERAASGHNTDMGARIADTAHNAFAARLARDAIRLIIDNSGSSVHLLSDPLQRLARDANVACGHLIQDYEMLSEQHGRSMLGLPQETHFC